MTTTAGYLGEEAWENPSNGLISTVYYWETLAALQQLVEHPTHLAAKQKQAKWISGYHIVIAQVIRSYGDPLRQNSCRFQFRSG